MKSYEPCDMIVSLSHLPAWEAPKGVRLKRAFVGDKPRILQFVREGGFADTWMGEVEHALLHNKLFIATENGKLLGFAGFDSSALGFFGPIGVDSTCRGRGVGRALLLRTLEAMREYGYGYAIIGWAGSAQPFYRKTVGAECIPGASPENSVYSNMIDK